VVWKLCGWLAHLGQIIMQCALWCMEHGMQGSKLGRQLTRCTQGFGDPSGNPGRDAGLGLLVVGDIGVCWQRPG
jgi:hypothetical protein